jgi:hypothetical protein
LTPPVLQVATSGETPSTQTVAAFLSVHDTPETLQTPGFGWQSGVSNLQLAPALLALASQTPGLIVQVGELVVQDVPGFPELASQVPAIRQPLLLLVAPVQVLVGWLLQ